MNQIAGRVDLLGIIDLLAQIRDDDTENDEDNRYRDTYRDEHIEDVEYAFSVS